MKQLIVLFALSSLISLTFSSGRLGNIDASDQFAAAMQFVATGSFGFDSPPGGFVGTMDVKGESIEVPQGTFWVSPSGKYFQTHEIGNPSLMVPIAYVAMLVKGPLDPSTSPPPWLKALVSLVFALQGAVIVVLLYKSLCLLMSPKSAVAWSLLFLPSSFFLTYIRMPWDVTGAACFATLCMYFTLKFLLAGNNFREIVLAAFAAGCATNFRFSFGPLLAIFVCIAASAHWRQLRVGNLIALVIATTIALIPSLWYNQIRMGSPFHPATLIPRYPTNPEWSLKNLDHLWRLFFSLNKGLVFYFPVCLFAFWPSPPDLRRFKIGVAALLLVYGAALSAIPAWAAGLSWGPRYFVPMLPILYFCFVTSVHSLSRPWKQTALATLGFSILVNFPTFITNYLLCLTEYLPAHDDRSNWPYPQYALWRGMFNGILGKGPELRAETLEQLESGAGSVSDVFPDLMIFQLAHRLGSFPAIMASLLVVVLVVVFCRVIIRSSLFESKQQAKA